jgi:sec-independent protein translocase protein TatA
MGLGDLKWPELLIIGGVLVLLFGSKKLPDAARGIGRSLRIFKSEVKGMDDDDKATATAAPSAIEQAPAQVQAPAQTVQQAQPEQPTA